LKRPIAIVVLLVSACSKPAPPPAAAEHDHARVHVARGDCGLAQLRAGSRDAKGCTALDELVDVDEERA